MRLHALDIGADEVRLKWLLCGLDGRVVAAMMMMTASAVVRRNVLRHRLVTLANTAPPAGILVPLLIEGLLSSMIQAEQRVCIALSPPRSELKSDNCHIMDSSASDRKCCAFVTVVVAVATLGGRSSPPWI